MEMLLARRGCTCILLMLAVLTCGSGVEDLGIQGLNDDTVDTDDMGEGSEGVTLINGPVENEGSVSAEDAEAIALGSKALETYSGIQSGLMHRADDLRAIYDHPPVPATGVTYSMIPGMVMRRKGMINHDKSRPDCEAVCNSYKSCLSYSYNQMKRECIWAMDSFHYGVADQFFLKKRGLDGKLTLEYETIPALMVHTSQGTSGETREECQYDCSKDPQCSGFSYTAGTATCISTTKDFIEFNQNWDYYEKKLDFTKIEPEVSVADALSEAREKKNSFSRHTNQQLVIRQEQGAKSQKHREGLRLRAIAAEKHFKKLQDGSLILNARYEKASMNREVAMNKEESDQKMYKSLKNANTPLSQKLSNAKMASDVANSKESKEKSDIDVRYFSRKLISSSSQTKKMKTEIDLSKPKEMASKKTFNELDKEKRTADASKAEAMGMVSYTQAGVDLGEKEKKTKAGVNLIMNLNFKLEAASLEKPFSQEKVDFVQESVMKAKAKQAATIGILARSKLVVKRIGEANKEKIELDEKVIKQIVAKKKEKHTKERAQKKTLAAKKKTAEINTKKHKEADLKSIKETQTKDQLARTAKSEADASAKRERRRLAKEEAHKAAQRAKFEKENARKNAENALFINNERSVKDKQRAASEKEVQNKFAELKAFKESLELSTKQEKQAKLEQDDAAEKKEKSFIVANELAKKSAVMANGYVKTKETADKAARKATAEKLVAALLSVKLKKIVMANTECNTQCIADGKVREQGQPVFVGCFKDRKDAPSMTSLHTAFNTNSLDFCNTHCGQISSNTIFGLQEDMCYCGTGKSYNKYGQASQQACVVQCTGNHLQLCGGPNVNRMYRVSVPANKYDWSGYTSNTSRPAIPSHFNFVENDCHCVGVPKTNGAPQLAKL